MGGDSWASFYSSSQTPTDLKVIEMVPLCSLSFSRASARSSRWVLALVKVRGVITDFINECKRAFV